MNCKTCGGEARPMYDEYKGRRYIVMWWCDECDEEVHPPEPKTHSGSCGYWDDQNVIPTICDCGLTKEKE